MKKILSYIVLLIGIVVLDILFGLLTKLVLWCLSLLVGLKTWVIVLIVVLAGSLFLAIVSLPVHYGTGYLMQMCENISPTKKGVRYYVFAGAWLVYSVLGIAAALSTKEYWLTIQVAMNAAAALTMIVLGKHFAKENEKADRYAKRQAEYKKNHPPIEDLMLDRKRQIAADMAANGDFTGYLDLGYSEEEVARAKEEWRRNNLT